MTSASTEQITGTLEVIVLDVGHGNCAVVRDGDRCAVVDAPPGPTLFDELERCGITHIDHLVLSHSDLDHMGSAVKLLWDTRFIIGMIWYNPDGTKQSKAWQNLARQAYLRHREGRLLNGQRNLNTASTADLSFSNRVKIEVLHPDLEMATLGPSDTVTPLGRLTANTLSAVLRISLQDNPAVLLPADIDALALQRMISLNADLKAHVLVFPHHGGRRRRLIPDSSLPRYVKLYSQSSFSFPWPAVAAFRTPTLKWLQECARRDLRLTSRVRSFQHTATVRRVCRPRKHTSTFMRRQVARPGRVALAR